MDDLLNTLIQRSVEHGFIEFFDRMESFFRKLSLTSSEKDERSQSAAITMENFWIFVYIFAAFNSFGAFIFLCEIIVFHWRTIIRAFNARCRATAFYWRKLIAYVRIMFLSIWNALNATSVWLRVKLRPIYNVWHGLWINLRALFGRVDDTQN